MNKHLMTILTLTLSFLSDESVSLQHKDCCQLRSQDFKVGRHTGDVARRADAGVRFLGRGSSMGPSHQLGGLGRAPPPPPKKSPRICTNPVGMPVGGRGARPPPPVVTLLTAVL